MKEIILIIIILFLAGMLRIDRINPFMHSECYGKGTIKYYVVSFRDNPVFQFGIWGAGR